MWSSSSSEEIIVHDQQQNEENGLEDEHQSWARALKKAIKALTKKQSSLESEWNKAQGVEATMARAQLIVNNLYVFQPGMKTATVQDWENGGVEVEVVLDSQYESANAEADALFAQARKLKRGTQVVTKLLEETSDAMELLQDAKLDLESAASSDTIDEGRLRLVQERLQRTAKVTNFNVPKTESSSSMTVERKQSSKKRNANEKLGTPASNVRKLLAPESGCPILVGRNRRGNEYLTFNVAKGDDIWMHARGCPGAHVVVQVRRGGPQPTDDCLQLAANLAAFYSDARNEQKAQVMAAEPKHLLKPRGAPLGAVKTREELQSFVGRPDDVPDSLKLARDKSGLSDEYHVKDKAKHRKRTQEVAKQNLAKKRADSRNKRKERRANRAAKTDELPDFF
eukprot:CAMPEP_0195306198 /NCGR_PEP_ID=MMETSP0707-20130614/37078_1 /TAXON_ID=33640 /ORGANISM="Asterionellopsis glacialis, Strain CCMP134" /LENGTH=396 /DNA_ID=CAMNT_0040370409 /DNA_START=169 /DNA_END=1359 /DNA_ORIENTATION=-